MNIELLVEIANYLAYTDDATTYSELLTEELAAVKYPNIQLPNIYSLTMRSKMTMSMTLEYKQPKASPSLLVLLQLKTCSMFQTLC